MKTKIVYAYHPDTGAFLRPIILDEGDMSPLEHGVWHIPGDCAEVEPPIPADGQYAAFLSGGWQLRAIPQPELEVPAVAPDAHIPARGEAIITLEAAVQSSMDVLARAYRYTDLADAVSFADDIDSPKFYAEGRMFRKLRGQVWMAVEPLLDELRADESLPVPSFEELQPMLPTLDVEQAVFDGRSMQVALDVKAAAAAKPKRKGKGA